MLDRTWAEILDPPVDQLTHAIDYLPGEVNGLVERLRSLRPLARLPPGLHSNLGGSSQLQRSIMQVLRQAAAFVNVGLLPKPSEAEARRDFGNKGIQTSQNSFQAPVV